MAKRKRPNGMGESVTVYFDKTDPQERRALEMAKLLAGKHGRRKDAIIALLDALYEYYQSTGELMTSTAIANAIVRNRPGFNPPPVAANLLTRPSEPSGAGGVKPLHAPQFSAPALDDDTVLPDIRSVSGQTRRPMRNFTNSIFNA